MQIVIENSTKGYLERNEYNEGDVVQFTNWISKNHIKIPCFKREKPKKGSKHQRTEKNDI